ncbi:MAG: PKD domain-containing protein, partial [Planctomycetota bacterium]
MSGYDLPSLSRRVAAAGVALLVAAGCGEPDVEPVINVGEFAEASANAGPDQKVAPPATVTLDGSASHGPGTGASPGGGAPSGYVWTQITGTTVSLDLTDPAKPTFPAPAGPETLTFRLTVGGDTDTVNVTVQPLTVDVGADVVVGGYGVTVNITVSVEPAGAYEYAWTQSDGSPLPASWTPLNADTPMLSLTTPLLTDVMSVPGDFGMLGIDGDAKGLIHVKVMVANDLASPAVSDTDVLNVQIVGATGTVRVVPVGVACFLNGGASIDGVNPVTGWSWAGTGSLTLPDGATSDPTGRVQMFVPPAEGDYVFTCVRTDGISPPETMGITVRAASYVGVGTMGGRTPDQAKGECASCHRGQYDIVGNQAGPWELTGHATMFEHRIGSYQSKGSWEDAYCIQCHTTGFNPQNDIASVTNGGWDDVAEAAGWQLVGSTWEDVVLEEPALADISSIQCEACHGPGSLHSGDTVGTAVSLKAENCGQCHGQVRSLAKTAHSRVSPGSMIPVPSCQGCHRAQGFIERIETGSVSGVGPGDESVAQTCAACHDPHSPMYEHQLRAEGFVLLPTGVIRDYGKSALCVECHNGRNDVRRDVSLA